MVIYVLQGAVLALSATIMPGPFQAFLLSKALRNGWKRTLPAAFAPVATDGPIIVLVMLVLTRMPQLLVDLQHIAGGLFILYIAKGMMTAFNREVFSEPSPAAARKSFFQAVVINALNPNPYIFWTMVGGPIILSGWRESPGLGIGFIVGFFGTFVIGLSVLIVMFATAGKISPRANTVLRVIAAVILLGFGLYQIGIGIQAVLAS